MIFWRGSALEGAKCWPPTPEHRQTQTSFWLVVWWICSFLASAFIGNLGKSWSIIDREILRGFYGSIIIIWDSELDAEQFDCRDYTSKINTLLKQIGLKNPSFSEGSSLRKILLICQKATFIQYIRIIYRTRPLTLIWALNQKKIILEIRLGIMLGLFNCNHRDLNKIKKCINLNSLPMNPLALVKVGMVQSAIVLAGCTLCYITQGYPAFCQWFRLALCIFVCQVLLFKAMYSIIPSFPSFSLGPPSM